MIQPGALQQIRSALKPVETIEKSVDGHILTIPVATEQINVQQVETILILCENKPDVLEMEWFSRDHVKIIFCSASCKSQLHSSQSQVQLNGCLKRNNVKEIVGFEDYRFSGLVPLKALELHEKYTITRVVCLAEADILRAARVRQLLGIEASGQTVRSASHFRDKVLMKTCLQNHGIRVPTFAAADSFEDIISFQRTHGFPFVIKPRKGYGAIGACIIKKAADLTDFFAKCGSHLVADEPFDFDVERFIWGTFFHIDGVVVDDEIRSIWPSQYTSGCAGFEESNSLASFALLPSNPLRRPIQDYMVKVLGALDCPKSFAFHGEVWVQQFVHTYSWSDVHDRSLSSILEEQRCLLEVSEDDWALRLAIIDQKGDYIDWSAPLSADMFPLTAQFPKQVDANKDIILCEVASRMGGAGVKEVHQALFEIDLERTWAVTQANDVIKNKRVSESSWHERVPLTDETYGWILVYPKIGKLLSIPTSKASGPPGLKQFHYYAGPGSIFEKRSSCVDCVSKLIVSARTEEDCTKALEEAYEWFCKHTVYEPLEFGATAESDAML